MSDGAYTQHSSGIIIPTATLDKTQRTLLDDDFRKRFEKFMAFAGETYGMLVVFHCRRCLKRIRMRRFGRIDDLTVTPEGPQDAPGGQVQLFCDCTDWNVR